MQAFTGATLIDEDGARFDNAVLVIRDGRVTSAGRSGAVAIPKEARQIPLAGKFVIPGLISAHVHVSDVQGLAPRATDENAAATRRVRTLRDYDRPESGRGTAAGFAARDGQSTQPRSIARASTCPERS